MLRAIDCLCIWLALFGCGVAVSAARAQDNFVCGNLYLRVTPDPATSGNWFLFQVFRHEGGRESPVLAGTPFTPAVPSARCVGGLVLMIAFSLQHPVTLLRFSSSRMGLVCSNCWVMATTKFEGMSSSFRRGRGYLRTLANAFPPNTAIYSTTESGSRAGPTTRRTYRAIGLDHEPYGSRCLCGWLDLWLVHDYLDHIDQKGDWP
jgi:hypothetical protein